MRQAGREERWRVFVALPVPAEAAASLVDGLREYVRAFPEARWLPADTLHVTLVFLGSVTSWYADHLRRALGETAAAQPAFAVRVEGGDGRLGPRRDGVAWLPMVEGAGVVIGLADSLRVSLAAALDQDGSDARRAQSAHVTVARRVDGALLAALRTARLGVVGTGWQVDRVTLFCSHLGPGGSRYEALAEAPLGAR